MKCKPMRLLQFSWFLLLFACLPLRYAWGQCESFQVTHFSGTQQVGCVEVTVTSEGSAGFNSFCGYGPYGVGNFATGSYTFTFSPVIPEVRISLAVINDNPPFGVEELSFEINGSFYPITNPGIDDGCTVPAIISPTGTIRAAPGSGSLGSSWQDVVITEPINSLKIEDIWLSGSPNGTVVKVLICCPGCQTDAGQITASPLNLCPDNVATVPTATQTFLEGDDLLQYILFSNPADTLGSIIATSNTPSFSFNPGTMQTGVTYYIAAIAGNNLGGNVDLNDPCLDISNAIQVTWRPLPTVTFSAANPDVCAGACTTITANFIGTPPFTLTYTSPVSGSVTQTFSGNTGTFQVCTAAGSPPGSFSVQATALADAWCTCQ